MGGFGLGVGSSQFLHDTPPFNILADTNALSGHELSGMKEFNIKYVTADAKNLPFDNDFFDLVIFSFNGLMTTPGNSCRRRICNEVYRVLRKGGIFIFTAHDRNSDEKSINFWRNEYISWKNKTNDQRLLDFGDRLFQDDGFETYLHIPDEGEINDMLKLSGFAVIKRVISSKISVENDAAASFFGDSFFWIAYSYDWQD